MKRLAFVSGIMSILVVCSMVASSETPSIRTLSFDEMETLFGGQSSPCVYCDNYSWKVKGATLCETNGYSIVYDALCHPTGGADCVNIYELEDCSTCPKEEMYIDDDPDYDIDGGNSASVRHWCWAGTTYNWNCSGGFLDDVDNGRWLCP